MKNKSALEGSNLNTETNALIDSSNIAEKARLVHEASKPSEAYLAASGEVEAQNASRPKDGEVSKQTDRVEDQKQGEKNESTVLDDTIKEKQASEQPEGAKDDANEKSQDKPEEKTNDQNNEQAEDSKEEGKQKEGENANQESNAKEVSFEVFNVLETTKSSSWWSINGNKETRRGS